MSDTVHERCQLWIPGHVLGRAPQGARERAHELRMLRHLHGCDVCQATVAAVRHVGSQPAAPADSQLEHLLDATSGVPQERLRAHTLRHARRAGRFTAVRPAWQYVAALVAAAVAIVAARRRR